MEVWLSKYECTVITKFVPATMRLTAVGFSNPTVLKTVAELQRSISNCSPPFHDSSLRSGTLTSTLKN